jgi:hypothetical protein
MFHTSGRSINKFWISVVANIIFVARRIRWVGRTELNTEFWWEYLWESGYFEDIDEDERIILKCFFKTQDGKARAGLIWLMIQTGAGCFYVQQRTFEFHKMRGNS